MEVNRNDVFTNVTLPQKEYAFSLRTMVVTHEVIIVINKD